MKSPLICLALLVAALPALAQTETPDANERARIAAEREQAQARLASEEAACYRVFAVNDCLKAVRAQSRERLADLRRREVALNDAERKRQAQARQQALEERNSPEKQEEDAARRAEAVARQQEKAQALEKRAAERTGPAASGSAPGSGSESRAAPGGTPREPKAVKPPASHDTAAELRRTQERQQDAKERQERVAKRQAEAASSAAKPLPVPP